MFVDQAAIQQFVAQCVEAELKKRLPEPPQFLSMAEVKALCGVKKGQTVQALEQKGVIAKRVPGEVRPRWRRADFYAHVPQSRSAKSDAAGLQ